MGRSVFSVVLVSLNYNLYYFVMSQTMDVFTGCRPRPNKNGKAFQNKWFKFFGLIILFSAANTLQENKAEL